MKKTYFCIVLIGLLCISIYSQKLQNPKFVGTFQDCDIHCSTYYINSNFTFKHRFNGEEKSGTWKYVSKNKIKLFAPRKKEETLSISIKTENDEFVNSELQIPATPAFKRIFIFQNDSICIVNKKKISDFCYEKIERTTQNH